MKSSVCSSLLEEPATTEPLYGDMVLCLIGTGGTVFYSFETYFLFKSTNDEDLKKNAITFLFLHSWPLIFHYTSVWNRNLWCSRVALLGVLFMLAYGNIVQYPYPGECSITQLYQGQVVMSVMANLPLSFGEKMARLALIFLLGSYVSMTSPFSVYVEDTLPILGGTVLMAIFVLYVYHFSIARQYATVQAARLVVAASFFYHTIVNMPDIQSTSPDKFTSLMKAAGLACVGILATGAFQQELLQKEQLEMLVQKRSQKLHMVNMALQASETAIVITDKTGSIIWVNKAFDNMCGKHEKSLIGKFIKDVIYDCDPSRKENKFALMESYEDPSRAREAELQIGESIYAHESTPFPEQEVVGQIPRENNRFLMVFKDITAGRAREVAEQKAQDKALMAKAMGDSMVTLTHELRTPLQGIMGMTSLLMQSHEFSSDAMESLKLIMASSTLLLNLVNNSLDVKKASAKMLEEFPLSPASAPSAIKDAIIFSKPLASISDVEVSSDVSLAPNAVVWSNSLRLQQVLINLVSNAIKYTAKDSKIIVKTRESTVSDVHTTIDSALASSRDGCSTSEDSVNNQAVLVFSVSDCGPGIEPDQAHRLFQRFCQLDNQSSRSFGSSKIGQPSGTGLGLHLCQLFVRRMNGHIWATNNNSGRKGSTFSFSLPLLSNDLPQNADVANTIINSGNQGQLDDPSPIQKPNQDDSLLNKSDIHLVYGRRILLVDDTLINRKVLSRILAKVGFSNVTTVDSGQAALIELSNQQNYDFVISDLQMPGISGTELSKAIATMASTDDNFHQPVVIGLTADTSLDVVERCKSNNMSDVLYKPITVGEVKIYVESVISSLQPGVWHDGDIKEDGYRFGTETSLPVQ